MLRSAQQTLLHALSGSLRLYDYVTAGLSAPRPHGAPPDIMRARTRGFCVAFRPGGRGNGGFACIIFFFTRRRVHSDSGRDAVWTATLVAFAPSFQLPGRERRLRCSSRLARHHSCSPSIRSERAATTCALSLQSAQRRTALSSLRLDHREAVVRAVSAFQQLMRRAACGPK